MRTMVWIVWLTVVGLAAADERPRLRGTETPRATQLLQAGKMAKRAASRLRTPAPHRAGWQHGGKGWESGREAPPAPSQVTIDLRGPRRRVTAP